MLPDVCVDVCAYITGSQTRRHATLPHHHFPSISPPPTPPASQMLCMRVRDSVRIAFRHLPL